VIEVMADTSVDLNTERASYTRRMTKLTDDELRREYDTLIHHPKVSSKAESIKMKVQTLQLIAKDRGILL
jgi:type III secretory pathway component EscU